MYIDIVIPTLNRLKKLKNCVGSIVKAKKEHQIHLYVYCNNRYDFNVATELVLTYKWVTVVLFEEYRVPEFWNNHMKKTQADIMIYLNDDILMFEDCLDAIENSFIERFPDYDGVIGINQENIPDGLDTAFGAVGRKYANRFPDRQFYCPDYYRFYGDSEIGDYAKKINKFYFCKEAKITHLHPSFYPELKDTTHATVRTYLARDREINTLRKNKNLLWGESFELIEGKIQ